MARTSENSCEDERGALGVTESATLQSAPASVHHPDTYPTPTGESFGETMRPHTLAACVSDRGARGDQTTALAHSGRPTG